jgi:uncharacterized phage protein (TIGR01671 family)
MRQIKFRAKGLNDDNWHYGSYVYTDDNKNNPFASGPFKENHHIIQYYPGDWNLGGWEPIEIDPNTLGQFTSLKDKNGKEIYEGDVIAFNWRSSDGVDITDLLEVRFIRGVFVFLWDGDIDHEANIVSPTHEWATVVGNIHDNPDLIKNS